MGVGTSLGQSYDDEFHYSQSQWDSKYDTNEKSSAISIKPVSDPGDMTSQFNTELSPSEQQDYSSKFKPGDNYDYDMQGWYKANPGVEPNAEGVHYPDTFKKPNHPTFSDQSQYSSPETPGGKWEQQPTGSYNFTPADTNLKYRSQEELQQYFNKVEPTNKLITPDVHPEPYGLNPPPSKFFDRLFGLNGEERYQTWPEEAVRGIGKAFDVANKVSSGEVSMWAQDPDTGEFHTSIEGMKNAWELMPLAMGGQIPLKIHLGQPSEVTTLRSLSEHEDEFAAMIRRYREEGFTTNQRQEMAYPEQDARMANHPRWNEGNHPEPGHISYEDRIAESRAMSESLGHSGELSHDFPFDTPHPAAARSDNAHFNQFMDDVRAMEVPPRQSIDPSAPGVGNWRRVDANQFEADMRAQDTAAASQYTNEIRELLRQSRLQESWKTKAVGSDTISEGQIYLSRLKSPFQEHETKHRFRFFDEKSGSKGHMMITEKQNGKQIYVEGIGLQDLINPQDIGPRGMKDMLYALKKEFPHAETIAGFRISGARARASATGHAEMKLPKVPRKP